MLSKVKVPESSQSPGSTSVLVRTKPAETARQRLGLLDLNKFLISAKVPRRVLELQERQTLFNQGDPANAAFYILYGKVAMVLTSDQGKNAVVAVLDTGDFCGLRCLAGEPHYAATAQTLTNCRVMRIEKFEISRLLREQPPFSEMIAKYLLIRSVKAERAVIDQLFNSSEKRLARALLVLAQFRKKGQPMPAIATINHQILSEMVGTTRSRVTFFMNKFRRRGFIHYSDGQLEVRDSLLSVLTKGLPQSRDAPGFEDFEEVDSARS
jgi:CRP-like cAMP-binding protein